MLFSKMSNFHSFMLEYLKPAPFSTSSTHSTQDIHSAVKKQKNHKFLGHCSLYCVKTTMGERERLASTTKRWGLSAMFEVAWGEGGGTPPTGEGGKEIYKGIRPTGIEL